MTGLGHGQAGRLRGRARSGALLVNAWRQTSTATRQREGHWNRTNVSGKWADKGRVGARSAPSPRASGTPAIRCFAHAGQREMMMSPRTAVAFRAVPSPLAFRAVPGSESATCSPKRSPPWHGTMWCLFSRCLLRRAGVLRSCFNLVSKDWLNIMTKF